MDGRILLPTSRFRESVPGLQGPPAIAELQGWTPTVERPPENESMGSVSLIIPTFFNSDLKQASLRHVLSGISHSRSVKEVILVDSDGESGRFEELQPLLAGRRLIVVRSDPNNRGKSRNTGAAAASQPVLFFLDDDMVVRRWENIDGIVTRMLTEGDDIALFPRRHYARFPLLYDDEMLGRVIAHWRSSAGAFDTPFLHDPLLHGGRDLPMYFCFPGCFMLISCDAFRRLGGFKEEFVGWGFEDTEFGLRAITHLRVRNLFRTDESLLHIDHPVSPYKSEEHNTNFARFYESSNSVDINVFCRRVFQGENFRPSSDPPGPTKAAPPWIEVAGHGIPLELQSVLAWHQRVAAARVRQWLSPLPKFVVLHGSRALGAEGAEEDYDILSLCCGGRQEFFVPAGSPRVEIELANLHHFEHIGAHPALYSYQGPMELAKIANAQLLWGDIAEWRRWSSHVMGEGMKRGWCFWLVLGLGLRYQKQKYGTMAERYFASLRQLYAHHLGPQAAEEALSFAERNLHELAAEALGELDRDWRERLATGEPIFERQVPEVWIALRRLAEKRIPNRRRQPAAKLQAPRCG